MIANGTAPVYLRITIDGERTDISSKRYPGIAIEEVLRQVGKWPDYL